MIVPTIDWSVVPDFSASEFPEDPDTCAEPQLIYTLQAFRTLLNTRIFPSQAKGALARFSGSVNSQHFAVDRLSTADDCFIEGIPMQILMTALGSRLFGGIGVYLDGTGPDGSAWIRFHLDIRPIEMTPVVWIVKDKMYYYPLNAPWHWSLLRDYRMYEDYRL